MRRICTITLAAISAIAGIAAFGFAQLEFLRFRIPQNNPPPTELVIARWRFSTNGRIGHMGWSPNSRGDLAMVVCFNNDFANFWDWIDNSRRYPLKPVSEAFRMEIKFLIYATTH